MKRLFDLLGASSALIVLAPVIIMIAVAIRIRLGTPIFFCQTRPGLHGLPFVLIKFRTMYESYDSNKRPLPDSERMSVFGRTLRRTSLDELPELWNVLKGDMSLVGPRPLLMEYLPRYNDYQMRRHEIRPGITGWAQINGRNAISWDDKFQLDIWYVDNQSFWLDLKILLITLLRVFEGRGVSQKGEVTTKKFHGSD